MKWTWGMILCIGLLLFPIMVWADDKYQSMGLKETCESEGIFFDHPEYQASSEKANIYMFRGQGCEHCQEFLTYLEAITEAYGDRFNLISYEVWQNSTNKRLMAKVAKKLNDKNTGVPYIIIGEKSWAGYSDSLNEELFQAITSEYENKNQNDVVSKVLIGDDPFPFSDLVVVLSAIIVVGLFFFARSKTKESVLEEGISEN